MKRLVLETLEVLLIALAIFFAIHFMLQNFRIEGSSMEPNLLDGQYVLVLKTPYWFGNNPSRGEIIVAHHPTGGEDVIKRVIGLPGETVEVKRDGSVYIDGQKIEEPYISSPPGMPHPAEVVPLDNYFVMGDHRDVSADSRVWGTVPRNDVVGRAWIIIWPMHDWGFAPNRTIEFEIPTSTLQPAYP
jgi:signal peptidase I